MSSDFPSTKRFSKNTILIDVSLEITPNIYFYSNEFCTQVHIKGRTLALYAYLLRFIANLGKKMHVTSSMNVYITMQLIWFQTNKISKKKFQNI